MLQQNGPGALGQSGPRKDQTIPLPEAMPEQHSARYGWEVEAKMLSISEPLRSQWRGLPRPAK